ncbi:Hypp950 [Branchiostoma lanceolatum]|uniref:Hypp950 protein n=1 Tax=Branchiostoma lanceolatum TaxID=7740 RepID=A0A8K0EIF2_BRALA|nr:Hypp950 [Branchiostoma lanceolatum]
MLNVSHDKFKIIPVRASSHRPTPVLGNGSACSPQSNLSSHGDADALVQNGAVALRSCSRDPRRRAVPQPVRHSAGPGATGRRRGPDVGPLPQQLGKVRPGRDAEICITYRTYSTVGSGNGEVKIGSRLDEAVSEAGMLRAAWRQLLVQVLLLRAHSRTARRLFTH